jgi:hypothetical protein
LQTAKRPALLDIGRAIIHFISDQQMDLLLLKSLRNVDQGQGGEDASQRPDARGADLHMSLALSDVGDDSAHAPPPDPRSSETADSPGGPTEAGEDQPGPPSRPVPPFLKRVAWFCAIVGIVGILCAINSMYCVLLLLNTFCSTFLVAYIVTPLYAVFERDWTIVALAFVRLVTYVPLVAYVLFVFASMILSVRDALAAAFPLYIDYMMNFAEEVAQLGEGVDWDKACYAWITKLTPTWCGTAAALVLTFYSHSTILVIGLLLTGIPIFLGNLGLFFVGFVCFLDIFARQSESAGKRGCKPLAVLREILDGFHKFRTDTRARRIEEPKDGTNSEWENLKLIFFGKAFIDITEWTVTFRYQMIERKQRILARIFVTIFLVLNILILVADVIVYHSRPLPSFLASICLRGIFCPIIAYFHPLTPFLYKCEFPRLRYSCFTAVGFVIVLILTVMIAIFVVPWYLNHDRFSQLPPLPDNWTHEPDFPPRDMVCRARYEGLSLLDAIGLAFGGYDIKRDPTLFDEQLAYFFGPSASEINASVEYLADGIPMVIYHISDTTVFGFRGLSSGPELAIQVELIAHHYAVPLILDLTPLYRTITDFFLSTHVPTIYNLGINFFLVAVTL